MHTLPQTLQEGWTRGRTVAAASTRADKRRVAARMQRRVPDGCGVGVRHHTQRMAQTKFYSTGVLFRNGICRYTVHV